jgi:hypothetical protein
MPRKKTVDEQELRATDYACYQCGQGIPATTIEKRKSRGDENWQLCADCVRVETRCITYIHPLLGKIFCYPHKGELDELWRPLDDTGGLFRPGERVCGHFDCVNVRHIRKHTATPKPLNREVKSVVDPEELKLALLEAKKYDRKKVGA